MLKYIATILCSIFCGQLCGQENSGVNTVSHYSLAQKRLLLLSTASFIHRVIQDDVDRDSVLILACQITGLPFLLAYDEHIGRGSPGAKLINNGRIKEAVRLQTKLNAEQRMQLQAELAIWYLHKPGASTSDMDSANIFIQMLMPVNTDSKHWRDIYALLKGEYFRQLQKEDDSKKVFDELWVRVASDDTTTLPATTLHNVASLSGDDNFTRVQLLNKALTHCQQYGHVEKEIEILWSLLDVNFGFDPVPLEQYLSRIDSLQRSSGFRHLLYVDYSFAFTSVLRAKYLEATNYARTALQNYEWSGMTNLSAPFFSRIGLSYRALGMNDESLTWFKKALDLRRSEPQFSWYKSLFYTASLQVDMGRIDDAISLLNQITKEYPPLSPWQDAQLSTLYGYCYGKKGELGMAGTHYGRILEIIDKSPNIENRMPFENLAEAGRLFVQLSNEKMARLFLEKALAIKSSSPHVEMEKHYLMYKIDSMARDYRSALQHHVQYKFFADSAASAFQRRAFDQLTAKYNSEKKDQDIKMLKEHELVLQGNAERDQLTRQILIAVAVLLLVIAALLFNRYKLKQRSSAKIDAKNAELQQAITDKEWLLKEVHHRVKNNLQIMISLLNTQSNYLSDEGALQAIRESQERMYAISLIHQKLYSAEDTSFINVREYIHDLVKQFKSGLAGQTSITFDIEADELRLDVAQAVPLGLILNEAISNSIKYAFPNRARGRVKISVTRTEDGLHKLSITDDGVGLPLSQNNNDHESFGIRLMQGLSRQLGGSLTVESRSGVSVEVSFRPAVLVK
ncbi:histidine kinase dimerization/phosphoacceptor domain -containing protein [Chryseolinea sp. T2]|uniref:tetratricopeptide repeat-containing sensor histidine kinase n=1 Tax=Chryseolinea sp. T2 TaxID=3129255 RepID=UPI0030779AD5